MARYSVHVHGADGESAERILQGIESGVEQAEIDIEEATIELEVEDTDDDDEIHPYDVRR